MCSCGSALDALRTVDSSPPTALTGSTGPEPELPEPEEAEAEPAAAEPAPPDAADPALGRRTRRRLATIPRPHRRRRPSPVREPRANCRRSRTRNPSRTA